MSSISRLSNTWSETTVTAISLARSDNDDGAYNRARVGAKRDWNAVRLGARAVQLANGSFYLWAISSGGLQMPIQQMVAYETGISNQKCWITRICVGVVVGE